MIDYKVGKKKKKRGWMDDEDCGEVGLPLEAGTSSETVPVAGSTKVTAGLNAR